MHLIAPLCGARSGALPASSPRDGNRTKITHPDGAWFETRYDGLDRPSFIFEQTTTWRFLEGYNQYDNLRLR
jgi:hypothetical protein